MPNQKNNRDDAPIDALRGCERDVETALSMLADSEQEGVYADLREHERYSYGANAKIEITIKFNDGSTATCLAKVRNLSRGGIGFLHGNFIHPNLTCNVRLTTRNGHPMVVTGKVMRCRHVSGKIHEVGVRFDERLDLKRFLDEYDPEDDINKSDSKTPRFNGKLLYFETRKADAQLMQFFVERMGLRLTVVTKFSEAQRLTKINNYDLILTDIWFDGDKTGVDFVRELRRQGYPFPIVCVTADPQPNNHQIMLSAGCSEILTKPFTQEAVGAMLSNYLKRERLGENNLPLVSALWNDAKLRPLILNFLEQLETDIEELERLVLAREFNQAVPMLRDLKGSAGGYGYPRICEVARELENVLTCSQSQDQLRTLFDELGALCASACIVRRDGVKPAKD